MDLHLLNIKKWQDYARANNVPKYLASPPIDRLLLKMKVKSPPLFFWSFPIVGLIFGIGFAVIWGTFMYIIVWQGSRTLFEIITSMVLAGVLYGISMSTIHWGLRRRHKLSSWEDFLNSLTKQ